MLTWRQCKFVSETLSLGFKRWFRHVITSLIFSILLNTRLKNFSDSVKCLTDMHIKKYNKMKFYYLREINIKEYRENDSEDGEGGAHVSENPQ